MDALYWSQNVLNKQAFLERNLIAFIHFAPILNISGYLKFISKKALNIQNSPVGIKKITQRHEDGVMSRVISDYYDYT